MSRKLLADSALYTVANLLSRFASLAALAILPLLLDIREYGVIGLVAAIAAVVNILVPLEVSQGLARFYATADEPDKARFAGTAWWFTFGTLTLAAALGAAFSVTLSEILFGSSDYRPAFLIAIVFWWGNCAFLFLQNQFRWSFRPRLYAVFSLAFAIMMLAGAVSLAANFRDPLLGAVSGWAIAAMIVTIGALSFLRPVLLSGISGRHLHRMLAFSSPLVPASLAIVVTTYFSRWALSDKVGLADAGLITFASQLAAIPSFVILGVQSALTPHVMAHFERPETPGILARLFECVAVVGFAASLGLALLSDVALPAIGYAAYSGAGPLIVFLAPAFLMQQLYIFAPGFAIAQRTGLQAVISILSGAAAVILNFLMIERWGVLGAAMATFVAALGFIAAWFAVASRYYPVPVHWSRLAAALMALAGCAMPGIIFEGWPGAAVSLTALFGVVVLAARIWWPSISRMLAKSESQADPSPSGPTPIS